MKKSLPLHIHIATLVIGLLLLLGLSSSAYNYIKTSDMLLQHSQMRITELSDGLKNEMLKNQQTLSLSLTILLKNGLAKAATSAERLQFLPAIQSVLTQLPNMTAFDIGYENGDFLIVRKLSHHSVFQASAPNDAIFMIDHISYKKRLLERRYSNNKGELLDLQIEEETEYDPRERDWYKKALRSKNMYISEVYDFYFSKQAGMTFALSNDEKTAVIAADLTLQSLNKRMQNIALTPSSQILIIDKKNTIIAQKNSAQAHSNMPKDNLVTFLMAQQKSFTDEKMQGTFIWQAEQWIIQKTNIHKNDDEALSLLVASPEKELVSEAIALRNISLIIQLLAIFIALPIAWFMAHRITLSLNQLSANAQKINRFDFSVTEQNPSLIKEVNSLAESMNTMRHTINSFLNIVKVISSENDLDKLLDSVVQQTCKTSQSDAAAVFLMNEDESALNLHNLYFSSDDKKIDHALCDTCYPIDNEKGGLIDVVKNKKSLLINYQTSDKKQLLFSAICEQLAFDSIDIYLQPLLNRKEEVIGVLMIISEQDRLANNESWIGFNHMLSHFSAVSLESRQLIHQQKALMQSFIELIASAIDAKSPYTGGHCQRVPTITKMLANAACESNSDLYKDFDLTEDEWEELHFSAWLHDCGKVTTPEYVVDKSTKLETLYDRIHEVRTRFEILKRDAEIKTWKNIATYNNRALESEINDAQLQALKKEQQQLDDDFAFIAQCNVGGEFMADDKIQRLEDIAHKTWLRTLPDDIGISWEEAQRKKLNTPQSLPVKEMLISDKIEHIIQRDKSDTFTINNRWGFDMQQPQYKYNRGELYNLAIRRGTLNDEERYKINDHIVQTIIMLENLPYPKHLRNVPDIAGGHHEKMDGSGYPRKLKKEDMPLTARMMAIADIFEALTAADRPYKKPKTLSQSLKIMSFMVKDKHIDADLFELFLRSGIYQRYGEEFLLKEQIDEVNIKDFLPS